MKIFGYKFKNLDDEHVRELLSLERECAIYGDFWIDSRHDFRHVRIKLTDAEVAEYVRSMKALDLLLSNNKRWA